MIFQNNVDVHHLFLRRAKIYQLSRDTCLIDFQSSVFRMSSIIGLIRNIFYAFNSMTRIENKKKNDMKKLSI